MSKRALTSFTGTFPQIVLDLGCTFRVGNEADVTVGADQEQHAGCDAVDVPDALVPGYGFVFPFSPPRRPSRSILAPPAESRRWHRRRRAGSCWSPSRNSVFVRGVFARYSDCGRSEESCSTILRAGYGDPSKRRCSWTRGRSCIRRPCPE